MSACVINGNWVHLIKVLKEKNYTNLDMDIAAVLSLAGIFFFNFSFLFFIKDYAKIIHNLSDFKPYGKPVKFDEKTKKLNFYSKIHGTYMFFCILIIVVSSNIKVGWCSLRSVYDCGIFIQPYMLFNIDHYPGRIFFFILKYIALCMTYQTSANLSFCMSELVEHINIRLDDVMEKFREALNEKNENQERDLKRAIQYHNFVIEISNEFNVSSRQCLFLHLLLTGIILGLMGYLSIYKLSFDCLVIFMGYFSSMALVSGGGQRIMHKSVSVSMAVYNTSWYTLDVKIQKLLVLVIARCQKPLHVRAGPFGIMNYALILGVLKTSYSCITFLLATNRA
ncbi:unnamed protein product [Brassicogethes aeneus]|uniref:Odorant receptor n=1 Tax=Brassicogethes aeneus TaxID=1431903 RepID=A0A9P0FLB3_BRAAE|nr:unnamed protein product [Brassicogethes aeneus]